MKIRSEERVVATPLAWVGVYLFVRSGIVQKVELRAHPSLRRSTRAAKLRTFRLGGWVRSSIFLDFHNFFSSNSLRDRSRVLAIGASEF
jgi:hypothetical protein